MVILCPNCKGDSPKVQNLTVKTHLIENLNEHQDQFFVCAKKGCPIVYFSENYSQKFTSKDLKQVFGLKEQLKQHTICYCFNYCIDDIHHHGASEITKRIREKMKEEKCNCVITNPLGRCCLSSISTLSNEPNTIQDSICCNEPS
jgi:hypothetical protein